VPDEPRDALEPKVATPATGLVAKVQRSDAWRSMFRHPQLDTPRGRALQSFSNFFLHLYPVKIPARVLRLRYSFRLRYIAAVLFALEEIIGDMNATLLGSTVVACIGPVTAEAAAQSNVQTTIQPSSYTIPALVDAIRREIEAAGFKPARDPMALWRR